MGQFSWITSDTGYAIRNDGDYRTVYMTAPDGTQWKESKYEGYGVFGGKDIYALIAELNKPDECVGDDEKDRQIGIDLTFEGNNNGEFEAAQRLNGYKFPTLTEKKDVDPLREPYPMSDPNQGWGYNDDW